ncbi:hypothetical protein IGI04_026103 [Brassica rapa subsp. trilocularis]|uniref:FBD domain-containing protein n=1 Tax=Brassica rapa subsp. trilocularis TaxID=1813537 RepID=A0ABQ7KYY8_BRACM|nr:hypothetical protein IGI04_026103 [Brassica rapa subsp. trilocularis]
MSELNTRHQTWYCKLPRITPLLQCNPILHLISCFVEHSPNVLFSFLGLSEEHPQYVGEVDFLEWFLQWNPKESLKKIQPLPFSSSIFSPIRFLSTCIGSGASSECVLVVSGGSAEGFGLSAMIRAILIFGNCTRNVRGNRRSMGTGGLGGCGCLAAKS